MKNIDAREWALLKQKSAIHLTNPAWMGGAYCVTQSEVHGRVQLPIGPWDAVVLNLKVAESR